MSAKFRISDQRLIAPHQGSPVVGASQIGKEREYLLALQARALELQAERGFGRRRGEANDDGTPHQVSRLAERRQYLRRGAASLRTISVIAPLPHLAASLQLKKESKCD
jgi:hypothetical protein